jgi:hypothetical protein
MTPTAILIEIPRSVSIGTTWINVPLIAISAQKKATPSSQNFGVRATAENSKPGSLCRSTEPFCLCNLISGASPNQSNTGMKDSTIMAMPMPT